MIVTYRTLPGSDGDRPFLDVLLGTTGHRVSGLVDSGAVHGLFHTDNAANAGVDLDGAEERTMLYGPSRLERIARFATLQMEFGGMTWEPEIGFADWISPDWGLLGQEALFRWFTITFFRADHEFEVVPIPE